MKAWPLGKWVLFVAIILASSNTQAQQSSRISSGQAAPSPQIVDPINDGNLVSLPGSPHLILSNNQDEGPVAADMVLGRLHLTLKRTAEQETSLQALLRSQQDSHSSQYHQWLTPDEFGSQFGPAQEDIDKIAAWLKSKGIVVTGVAKGRTSIEFSATPQQIQSAFRTQLHWFNTKAGRQYRNISDPKIPAALAPVVAGISSLNSHVSRPLSHAVKQTSGGGGISGTPPSYTSGTKNYLAPGDFWTIYNATPTETSGITGAGVTIGIAGRSDVAASDVAAFRSAFLGSSYSGSFQQMHNGADPGVATLYGDNVENALDVEWAGAIAPDANIVLVSSQTNGTDGVLLSAEYLIDNNLADIVSVSYGDCESFLWTGGILLYSSLWEQAAAQGITVVVAAGDSGSAGCDADTSEAAQFGLQVNGLASTPYNVAVGGTEFVDQGNSWAGSTNSTPLPGTSAQGYIPEEVWNEGQTFSTLYAGSGGASNCYFSLIDGDDTAGCGGGWPKPDWQAGVTGIPADGVRDLPDVSITAALHDAYVITLGGANVEVGGTSAGAPSFAGVMALLNQKAGGRQGLANYQLYALAGQEFGAAGSEKQTNLQSCNASLSQIASNACIFYDVTSGSNAVPCTGDTENCLSTDPSIAGMLTGYEAGTGYDLASGLGSINITNLVNGWSVPSKGNSPSTASLSFSPTTIQHGSSATVGITVKPTSGSGTPTGSVRLVANGTAAGTMQLVNGSYSGRFAALPGGAYQITAQYAGDGTYAASTSTPVTVDVTPEPSSTTISVTAKDAQLGTPLPLSSIPYGSNLIMGATVKGQSGIGVPVVTSGVMFTVGAHGGSSMLDPAGNASYALTTLSPGTYTATATFNGDPSFAPSTSAASPSFTVVTAITAVSINSGTMANGVTPITAVVSASSFGNAPTGTAALFANGTKVGTATVQAATPPSGQSWAVATFNLPTIALNAGANAITAQYEGDSNYFASPVSAPLTVTPADLTVIAPNPPAVPSMAQEFKPGAQVPISAIIFSGFQNLQVQWAAGMNPSSGWSSSGITISPNLSAPVLNAPIATWDTSSINAAGFYTLQVSVTGSAGTSTATTTVYLEPSLLSSNWPLLISDWGYMNNAPVPVTDDLGSTELIFGTKGPEAQLLKISIDGSGKTSYTLPNQGSAYVPAAGILHFSSGDDLVYPDGNAVAVIEADGTKQVLTPPASMSSLNIEFSSAQVLLDDVDGDSVPEVVTVGTPNSLTSAYLFAWRNNGQQLNSNFPVKILDANGDISAFAAPRVLVGDVDGDGQKEFVVIEGTTGSSFTPRLFAADGTPKSWNAPTIPMPYMYDMALADLDHNGKLETILVAGAPLGSSDSQIHVLNPDGSERQGWPQTVTGAQSIAVGDLNQDGNEEIVVSGNSLDVFNSDGTPSGSGWSNSACGYYGPAILADINGDGYPEIVSACTYAAILGTELLVLDRTGATIRSWNVVTGADQQFIGPITNVTAGDFLGDGKAELALGYELGPLGIGALTQMGAEVLATGWNYNAAASDWPMLHRNGRQNAVLRRVSPTTITLSASANPSNGASPASFVLTVTPSSGGSVTPTGMANLIDGDQNIGSCILASGSCSITPALAAGPHNLVAGYVGDRNYDVSFSATLSQTVNLVPTTTTLTISPNSTSLQAGSSYMLTTTVTPSTGSTVPTGSVVFTIGSATQTVALNASGVATYTGTAPTASGSLSLSAAYQGSTEFSSSTSSTLTENIVTNPAPSISGLSPSYVAAGSAGFTLSVNGSGFTNGSTIYWGNTPLATQHVSGTQLTAQVPVSNIASAGTTAITVQTPAPGGGTSAAFQFELDSANSASAAAPAFTTATATVSAGSTASYPVALSSSVSGVTVSCLNLPAGASCSYSSSSGAVSIVTSSATPSGTYQVTAVFTETRTVSASYVLAPFLLLPLMFLRRKLFSKGPWIAACMVAVMALGFIAATGCGAGGSGSQPVQTGPATEQVTTSGVVTLIVK